MTYRLDAVVAASDGVDLEVPTGMSFRPAPGADGEVAGGADALPLDRDVAAGASRAVVVGAAHRTMLSQRSARTWVAIASTIT